jgi:hypothetical protein
MANIADKGTGGFTARFLQFVISISSDMLADRTHGKATSPLPSSPEQYMGNPIRALHAHICVCAPLANQYLFGIDIGSCGTPRGISK